MCSISGECAHTRGPACFKTVLRKFFKRQFFLCSLSLCLSPIKEGSISVMPSSLISVQRVSSRDPAQTPWNHQSHPVNGQGEHRGLSCSFCPQGDRHPLNIRTRAHTHKLELELANFLLTILRIATRMASPWHDDLSSARLWFRIKPLQFSKQRGFVCFVCLFFIGWTSHPVF